LGEATDSGIEREIIVVTAAKTVSQVATHMGIAFAMTYYVTGSWALGGLAALIEPVINALLLPLHERAWRSTRRRALAGSVRYMAVAAEKLSQTCMHIGVAFGVMYGVTGSLVFGGLAALLEPIFNVIVLPFHERVWERIRMKYDSRRAPGCAVANA
jgi:uncharacterized membrane protein